MKKRLQGLIAGVLIGAMLTSGVVLAKQAAETINVIYDNIKILIDGKEYQPTDANGNVVEPFIYDGTTYLPVRAIANAFDKEVDWEAQTSTVILGSKNYDWLDQIGYVDYETTGIDNSFSAVFDKIQISDGTKQERGIQFKLNDKTSSRKKDDGTTECFQKISYLLNGNYKEFIGAVSYIQSGTGRDSASQIKIHGDGKLIYNSPNLSLGMKTSNFNIDVENIKLIEIKVEYINSKQTYGTYDDKWFSFPCIVNARLLK